jgi:hypothetical protein
MTLGVEELALRRAVAFGRTSRECQVGAPLFE